MYQLLVVDDEQYALEGIMRTIDWDSLGITNVYGAECAEDAKEIVLDHMPEIIICDIEMTEESGIDFLQWLHYGGFPARLIFLTAHANFAYAQEALRFGASEYLLKPVEHRILKKAVEAALRDYEKEAALHDRLSEYEVILRDWELTGGRGQIMGKASGQAAESGKPDDDQCGSPEAAGLSGISAEEKDSRAVEGISAAGLSAALDEPELIGVVKQYIRENLGELTRESIADAVSVNASYLSRVFHKATGEKLSAYILRSRIDYAKELLRDTNDKISYIANATGYLNDSYFIKVFRNVTEMTPYEYRKLCRKGGA